MPSKCSERDEGSASIPPLHVPSAACCIASVSAGRCVKGSADTCSVSAGVRRATSVSARYWIGAAAFRSSQSSGNRTGLGGGGAGAVAGVVTGDGGTAADGVGGGDDGMAGELFDGDGRVTEGSQS